MRSATTEIQHVLSTIINTLFFTDIIYIYLEKESEISSQTEKNPVFRM